jgi:hypothetical protein
MGFTMFLSVGPFWPRQNGPKGFFWGVLFATQTRPRWGKGQIGGEWRIDVVVEFLTLHSPQNQQYDDQCWLLLEVEMLRFALHDQSWRFA